MSRSILHRGLVTAGCALLTATVNAQTMSSEFVVSGDAAARMLDVLNLKSAASGTAPPQLATSRKLPVEGRILTREDWKQLEHDNLLAALRKASWKVSGVGGAAELLDMKPTTLVSRMKALGIEKPRER